MNIVIINDSMKRQKTIVNQVNKLSPDTSIIYRNDFFKIYIGSEHITPIDKKAKFIKDKIITGTDLEPPHAHAMVYGVTSNKPIGKLWLVKDNKFLWDEEQSKLIKQNVKALILTILHSDVSFYERAISIWTRKYGKVIRLFDGSIYEYNKQNYQIWCDQFNNIDNEYKLKVFIDNTISSNPQIVSDVLENSNDNNLLNALIKHFIVIEQDIPLSIMKSLSILLKNNNSFDKLIFQLCDKRMNQADYELVLAIYELTNDPNIKEQASVLLSVLS